MFEQADGGTLLLDDVSNLPLAVQGKLLRVIEEKKVQRLSGQRRIDVDVRVVATTNVPLWDEVARRSFRQDLYYRLHGIEIQVPPLRERINDILPLAELFLEEFNFKERKNIIFLWPKLKDIFIKYSWPGNVRELKQVIHQSVTILEFETITPQLISDLFSKTHGRFLNRTMAGNSIRSSLKKDVDELKRLRISGALMQAKGNKSQAAKLLGLDRMTFYRELKRLGIRETDV